MLKLIYKTFLISVLSGSLTTMNWVAYAADTTTVGVAGVTEEVVVDNSLRGTPPAAPEEESTELGRHITKVNSSNSKVTAAEAALTKAKAQAKAYRKMGGNDNLWKAADIEATFPTLKAEVTSAKKEATASETALSSGTKIEGVKEGTGAKIINSITMIVIGFVAAKLYKYNPVPDVMIAAAAGVAYLYGEYNSTKEVKEQSVQITKDTEGSNNTQLESFKKMKKDLEEVKKGMETKEIVQHVAWVGFGLALVASLTEATSKAVADATCLSTTSTAMTTCSLAPELIAVACSKTAVAYAACIAETAGASAAAVAKSAAAAKAIAEREANEVKICVPASSLTLNTTNTTGITAISLVEASSTTTLITAAATAPQVADATTPCTTAANSALAACKAADAAGKAVYTYGPPGGELASASPAFKKFYNQNVIVENKADKITPKFFGKLLNFLIPSARADMTTTLLSAIGGAGVALLIPMGKTVDNFLFTPKNRAWVWGFLGSLTLAAAVDSHSTVKEVESRIKKIDALIAELEKLEPTTGVTDPVTDPTIDPQTGKPVNNSTVPFSVKRYSSDFAIAAPDGKKIECAASTGSVNCASVTTPLLNAPDFNSLPLDVQNASRTISSFIDSSQGKPGITGAALRRTSASLDSFAANSNLAISKAQAKLNSQLSKAGLPAIDFKKEEANFAKDFNKTATAALKKAGISSSGLLASIGSGAGMASGTKAADHAAEAKKLSSFGSSSFGAAGGGSPSFPGSARNASGKDDQAALEKANEAANTSAKNDELLIPAGISNDSSASIFSLISERYIKSGYRRLFTPLK